MEYISVKDAASKFGITPRRTQVLCETGRIQDATMISGVWLIPEDAQKPIDARCTIAKEPEVSYGQLSFIEVEPDNNMLNLNGVCKFLSISTATGNNWIRLGKLTPSTYENNKPIFDKEDVKDLLTSIKSDSNTQLKSRRNKKQISGNSIYKNYIYDKQNNYPTIEKIVSLASCCEFAMNNPEIIIAEYAVKLLCQAHSIEIENNVSALEAYLNEKIDLGIYSVLIDSLLADKIISIPFQQLNSILNHKLTHSKFEDLLGLLYISLKNLGDRKTSGAYYTPVGVVEQLIENVFSNNQYYSGQEIVDPCCGTGNFLLFAAKHTKNISVIHGQDIDLLAVKIARINLALSFNLDDIDILINNITFEDSLQSSKLIRYDYIIGNPPWGYDFSESEIDWLCNNYKSATRNGIESYDLFLENAIFHLSEGGIVSFVLPEAMLNVRSHHVVRKLILQHTKIQHISYLGNIFDGVQCPSMIISLIKSKEPFTTIGTVVQKAGVKYLIKSDRNLTSDYFNLNISDEEFEILMKINNTHNCITLEGKADFALGIVTGDNKNSLSVKQGDGEEIVLKGSDILKYRIAKPQNYILFKPENFQQVAPVNLYRAKEKLLYRFICDSLVFAYDDKQTLSLNSCNILIPHIDELSIKYIMAILNSNVSQFFCSKSYNSLKLLRAHIEHIPIPFVEKNTQNSIVEIVDQIICSKDKRDIISSHAKLNELLMDLYNLSDIERHRINTFCETKNLFLI